MLNILFLAPRLPLPADTGGKIRTFNILKQLALEARVHLVCFSFETEDENYARELETLNITVTLVPIEEVSAVHKMLWLLLHVQPVSLLKYRTKLMRKVLHDLVGQNHFDAVHVDHLHMAHYLKSLNGLPCMLDEHNVEYKILQRCGDIEKNVIKKLIFHSQGRKMNNFESRLSQQFSCVFACSQDDKLLLNKITHGLVPIYVVPNGVDSDYFKHNIKGARDHGDNKREKKRQDDLEDAMVFTGSMDWLPNDDAITYFCRDILPLIWNQNNKVRLYVVGKNPSSYIKDLAAKDERVVVTGRVDDVRPFIEKSKVFIVPLRVGGGTRLKILEAMAMNKAVVSTRIGAEGIHYTEDLDIAIADTPFEFARKVIDLMEDAKKSRSMGAAARELIMELYDWRVVGKQLRHIYKEAVGEASK